MRMNNLQLKVKKGDVFWASTEDRANMLRKTRPFLVIEDSGNLEPYVHCLALTSNLKIRRGNVLLNDFALKKESIVLCNNIFRIHKKNLHGYIVSISKAEFRKVEIRLKQNQPKVSKY